MKLIWKVDDEVVHEKEYELGSTIQGIRYNWLRPDLITIDYKEMIDICIGGQFKDDPTKLNDYIDTTVKPATTLHGKVLFV